MKPLVILESPYRGGEGQWTCDMFSYGLRCLDDSLRRNEAPIASHLLYTLILNDADDDDRALGMEAGWAWYDKAEVCAVYIDNGISEGMQAGIDKAVEQGVPVEYRTL